MNNKKTSLCAVIDIGSSNIKLRIAQRTKNEMKELERLEQPVGIGHEVFSTGRIGFELLREISKILTGFSQIMSEYGVEQIQAVATTALRECRNWANVADQLMIQNGIHLEILEETQEKSLIYSEILRRFGEEKLTDFSNTLISYVGTGSIGVAACNHGEIVLMQNIRIGSVKIHDVLEGVEERTNKFYVVVEEYLNCLLSDIRKYIEKRSVKELILSGSEFEIIAKHCNVSPKKGIYEISGKEIQKLYDQTKVLSTEKLCTRYDMTEMEGDEFYAVLAIYDRLLKITKAERVYYINLDIWDPLTRHMLFSKKGEDELALLKNSVASAEWIAKRYHCDPAHYQFVRARAADIFDRTKKFHGLDRKYRLFLELAAILHECGHYVGSRNHLSASYDLIRSSELYGITREELRLIAILTKYDEHTVPGPDDADFSSFSEKRRLIISKLAAILRLANALDCSGCEKIDEVKLHVEGQKLVVTCVTDKETELEQWAFRVCAEFFRDVFGIKPVCEIKTKLL